MKVVIIDDEPLISDKLKRIMETGLRGMQYQSNHYFTLSGSGKCDFVL